MSLVAARPCEKVDHARGCDVSHLRWQFKSLKRHLQTAHQLTPREYRDAFKLKSDYPLVAPAYAARRSDLAKSLGLGRKAGMMKVAAQKVSAKRGGRKAAAVA